MDRMINHALGTLTWYDSKMPPEISKYDDSYSDMVIVKVYSNGVTDYSMGDYNHNNKQWRVRGIPEGQGFSVYAYAHINSNSSNFDDVFFSAKQILAIHDLYINGIFKTDGSSDLFSEWFNKNLYNLKEQLITAKVSGATLSVNALYSYIIAFIIDKWGVSGVLSNTEFEFEAQSSLKLDYVKVECGYNGIKMKILRQGQIKFDGEVQTYNDFKTILSLTKFLK